MCAYVEVYSGSKRGAVSKLRKRIEEGAKNLERLKDIVQ
jgi:hypothetical protein